MDLYIPSINVAIQKIVIAYMQEDYSKIKEIMDYVINSEHIAGSEDDYHNASVNLVRMDDYDNAVRLLEHGWKRYRKSTDILADLLEYGLKCRKLSDIRKYYEDELSKIDRKFWTWRAFHFSVDFLMKYIRYAESEEAYKFIITQIGGIISDYKKYKPNDERAYMIEHDFYELLNEHEAAQKVLEEALKSLKICPQCALNYADNLFENGRYEECVPVLERTVKMAEDQPSINIGYAYYILALSKEGVLRDKSKELTADNVKPIYDAYYSAIVSLDDEMEQMKDQCFRRVSILERQSGIASGIEKKGGYGQ